MIKFILVLFSTLTLCANAHQQRDNDFAPKNQKKSYNNKNAPIVLIDEAHHNFHTMDGRYDPFAKILQSDGYTVKKNTEVFSFESLSKADVLVISNALNKKNTSNWDLPNYSAFSRNEIEVVFRWVKNGGSLFLIADHMPFPKASEDLAAIFGFQFNNGYVEDLSNRAQIFSIDKGNLIPHEILKGTENNNVITTVKAFTGQAFLSPPKAKPLLKFGEQAVSIMPSRSWKFPDGTPEISVDGWYQGATLEFGKGRIVVFGEAAMFTAQLAGKEKFKMGVIAEGAEQNERFLLNIMLWLAKEI